MKQYQDICFYLLCSCFVLLQCLNANAASCHPSPGTSRSCWGRGQARRKGRQGKKKKKKKSILPLTQLKSSQQHTTFPSNCISPIIFYQKQQSKKKVQKVIYFELLIRWKFMDTHTFMSKCYNRLLSPFVMWLKTPDQQMESTFTSSPVVCLSHCVSQFLYLIRVQ